MARNPLLRTVTQELRQRPTRVLLTGLAIVVATLFAAGSIMFTDTMRVTLVNSASATGENVAAVVEPRNDYDEKNPDKPSPDLRAALKAVPGVAEVAPQGSLFFESPKDANAYWNVVSDTPGQLARTTLVSGKMPQGGLEAAVDQGTAKRHNVKAGDTVTLAGRGSRNKPVTLTVTGVVKQKGAYERTLVATADTVREMDPVFGFDRYELLAAAGTTPQQVVAAVKDKLGAQARRVVTGPEQRAEDLARMGSAADNVLLVLTVFTGLAMLAAALVVSSTFRIIIAQRRRRTALMRCVGAGRGQVLRAMLAEAGVTGVVAGVVGAALALALGYPVLAYINTLVEDPLPALQVSWPKLALVVVVAVVVTVVAAVGPAVAGTRVPPVAALGTARLSEAGSGYSKVRVVFMALCLLAAVGLLFLKPGGDRNPEANMLVVVGSGVFAFAALILGGPLLMPLLAKLLGAPVKAVGKVPGRIAVGNALRVPKRTAATTVVLTMGVGLIAAVLVGLSSAQAGAEERLDARYPAKVVLQASSPQDGVRPDLVKAVTNLAESGAVGQVSGTQLKAAGPLFTNDQARVTGVDVAAYPNLTKGWVLEGKLADLATGKVGLSQATAEKFGVKVGDKLTLTGPDGKLEPTVVAVYRDGAVLGPIALHVADLTTIAKNAVPQQLLVDTAPGYDTDKLRTAVSPLIAGGEVRMVVAEEEKKQIAQVITQMTYVVLGLVGMTVLVSVVGVAVTLSLSVVERTQESGLLRALGLNRGGLRAALAWEAVVFGACAAVVGLALGGLYGGLAVHSLEQFGAVAVPWGQLALVGLGLVAMALIAAVGPARRSARVSPLEALVAD
ncbi:putative ABC transport system permease protein [Crossiella equi]|uniref:ABC transport system permease protein n=1 Tax=Crossiella equi TaxID=130796 RepID=A0ABS5A810_9PSEU|nr:FtsX-like permease family protein [Crossiella equi]MBP2472725.1 putative ABC transport system permease protein [Crossiella equi]